MFSFFKRLIKNHTASANTKNNLKIKKNIFFNASLNGASNKKEPDSIPAHVVDSLLFLPTKHSIESDLHHYCRCIAAKRRRSSCQEKMADERSEQWSVQLRIESNSFTRGTAAAPHYYDYYDDDEVGCIG